MRWRIWGLALAGLLCAAIVGALVSPWPGVWLIRQVFDRGAAQASDRLAPLVPAGVRVEPLAGALPGSELYRPETPRAGAPMVVWVHGGGFVSGRAEDVANYLKILSGQGFVVANVEYSIAPDAQYPQPLVELDAVLRGLAARQDVPQRLVLAGDSAGAQIAGQMAALIANPDYAARVGVRPGLPRARLAGALLFCGAYEIGALGQGGGVLGWFVQVTGWAYAGRRDWREDPRFATMSLGPALTAAFPPVFLSAGQADPLEGQSRALAEALRGQGVPVEALFFPPDHPVPLGHEYQFDLTGAAGQAALRAAVAWLAAL